MLRCNIAFLLTFLSFTACASYNFDELCGNYSKKEGIVTSIASSGFSSKTSHGGGVVVTIDGSYGRVQGYIYKQYGYDYSYVPMIKIALIAKTLGKKVKACYDNEYIYVMQLE